MIRRSNEQDYFDWIYEMVCGDRFAETISYRKLLSYLHSIEFVYSNPMDSNRADDGIDLRYRYRYKTGNEAPHDYLGGNASVLEMITALAISCEERIMDNPLMGDRTGQWFWRMINNLNLSGMTDSRFDEEYVEDIVYKFLDRNYEPDGHGGLFVIRGCRYDLRDVDIWTQMMWFINTIT